MLDLSPVALMLLALAATLVGFSKTAVPGAATVTVAVFAAILPARQSTGTLLVLLILGDVFAVSAYHAHADWGALRRLVPTVLAGVVLGSLFLVIASDGVVRRVIGVTLLVLVAVTLVRRRHTASARANERTVPSTEPPGGTAAPWDRRAVQLRRLETGAYGILAGFTTMVANAGGPVMSMYFLAARFSITRFLGTAAWFFFAVNLAKVPFSVSLGLIGAASLRLDLLLAPAVVVGAVVGRRVTRVIKQSVFDRLILVLTVVSATYLLLQS